MKDSMLTVLHWAAHGMLPTYRKTSLTASMVSNQILPMTIPYFSYSFCRQTIPSLLHTRTPLTPVLMSSFPIILPFSPRPPILPILLWVWCFHLPILPKICHEMIAVLCWGCIVSRINTFYCGYIYRQRGCVNRTHKKPANSSTV